MNHIYRVVWNAVSATWTAVAETARGNGKGCKAATRRRGVLAFGALALIPPFALAQVGDPDFGVAHVCRRLVLSGWPRKFSPARC